MPVDVRLMNAVASAVFALAGVGIVAAGLLWLMRSPMFPIRTIQLDGDMARNSVPTIRANAAPRLAGNFFSVDLQQGRAAFESVPWVRRAVVRRVWPDRLAVRLEEHRAAALWEGPDAGASTDRLVNGYGEVFEANVGDVEDESLPSLRGPEGSAASMLAMYRRVQSTFARLDLHVERLHLSGRGSWRAELDSGASVELGRGSEPARRAHGALRAHAHAGHRTLEAAAGIRRPAPRRRLRRAPARCQHHLPTRRRHEAARGKDKLRTEHEAPKLTSFAAPRGG
jgi:cell division protein FtsQ